MIFLLHWRRRPKYSSIAIGFLFTVAVLFSLGFECGQKKELVEGTVRGTVHVMGNEPLTSLAIASEGKTYRLKASADIYSSLLKLQGNEIEVDYTSIDSTFEGITLSVNGFRQISH